MPKPFNVTLKYLTAAGKLVRFHGTVESVPGVDIFATAKALAPTRTRKGQIARVVYAVAVPL